MQISEPNDAVELLPLVRDNFHTPRTIQSCGRMLEGLLQDSLQNVSDLWGGLFFSFFRFGFSPCRISVRGHDSMEPSIGFLTLHLVCRAFFIVPKALKKLTVNFFQIGIFSETFSMPAWTIARGSKALDP